MLLSSPSLLSEIALTAGRTVHLRLDSEAHPSLPNLDHKQDFEAHPSFSKQDSEAHPSLPKQDSKAQAALAAVTNSLEISLPSPDLFNRTGPSVSPPRFLYSSFPLVGELIVLPDPSTRWCFSVGLSDEDLYNIDVLVYKEGATMKEVLEAVTGGDAGGEGGGVGDVGGRKRRRRGQTKRYLVLVFADVRQHV
uniref:Uncharacterized protein n=1 Tax=Chromera velia CCMP2878 TaxID=1169474 RepID=A0A0G4I8K7_9ALVE|eukprot:Cvel_11990.t1-p1 / transcript=Cvel_11990.t1 / gene=Cvel_11990 / organism=Chromera_velia_CCMP2878 / gene_product=hypothetical protein / transcript_product=hypothetical protein / location=Cvel_scaffold769:21003-25413(+) / protein_length=192 / sequence_SO=supercontig / SO=protein_coding / is_pseudo=false